MTGDLYPTKTRRQLLAEVANGQVLTDITAEPEDGDVIRRGRRFVGVELKPSYYRVAIRNLKTAEAGLNDGTLLAELAAAEELEVARG